MYGFNKETQAESAASKQFESGIHSNVELESVVFESPRKDGTGDKVLIFNFKGEKGEVFRHLEWPIGDQAADPAKSAESMSKRIKHIATKFMTEDEAVLSGRDYQEFCEGVVKLFAGKTEGKKVAIKLLYNKKGNLVFTKYLGFIGKNSNDLRVSANETPQLVKEAVQPTDVTSEGVSDDLPF